jgi:phosphoglycerate dehydrogenase-like enzyme
MSAAAQPIRVVVAWDFSDEIMAQLREVSPRLQIERHYPDAPDSIWPETEVLYTMRTFPTPQQAPKLRWIQLHFAGADSALKRPIVQSEDVEVTTASGVHAVNMAEWCLSMMLAFTYRLPLMLRLKAEIRWPDDRFRLFNPHGLRGQTLGIAGYGSIGRELARMADALGMDVLATKRNLLGSLADEGWREDDTGDPTGDIPARLYPPEALASMARECDFVVVTLPGTDSTRHAVNETVLGAMKKTAVLISVGRGSVIDEAALISALAAQKIGGAALDVFEEEPLPTTSPLWNLDNVIISPHVSGNNLRYNEKAARLFADNLRRYLENQPLFNRINREHGY